MTDHKLIAEKLKKALPGTKIHFSKSPRKGGKELWVFKMETRDERVNMLECLVQTGEVGEWTMFYSKDKLTTGLQLMATV